MILATGLMVRSQSGQVSHGFDADLVEGVLGLDELGDPPVRSKQDPIAVRLLKHHTTKAPNGDSDHRPTTRRMPEVVPMPAIWPVNRAAVAMAALDYCWTTRLSAQPVSSQRRWARAVWP
jgi:hypothetical protein